MNCPNCQSTAVRKYGFQNGRQRYQCKSCGRYFLVSYTSHGYSPEIKQMCIGMYHKGMKFRAIERATGIHHTTVILWVREAQKPLPPLSS